MWRHDAPPPPLTEVPLGDLEGVHWETIRRLNACGFTNCQQILDAHEAVRACLSDFEWAGIVRALKDIPRPHQRPPAA